MASDLNMVSKTRKYSPSYEKSFPIDSLSRENEINVLEPRSRTINSLHGNSNCRNLDVDKTTAISYRVSHLLIKSGKPFCDGELMKDVLNIFVDELFKECSEKSKIETAVHNISSSRPTIVRRMETMDVDLTAQLQNYIEECIFFSLQLDESTDIKDTAQLSVFIKLVFKDFTIKEEFLDILSLKGTTEGSDIYTIFKNCLVKHAVPLKKISFCNNWRRSRNARK